MRACLGFLSFCLFIALGTSFSAACTERSSPIFGPIPCESSLASTATDRDPRSETRQIALLPAPRHLGGDTGFQKVQGAITVTPSIVNTGSTPEVMIAASGFFDLGEIKESQISLRPGDGVSKLTIVWATAQQLKLSFALAADAAPGVRTLLIKNDAGATVVALDILLRTGPTICRPACQPPLTCQSNVCVGCDPPCGEGERCVGTICRPAAPPVFCNPPCRPGETCNANGMCERVMKP